MMKYLLFIASLFFIFSAEAQQQNTSKGTRYGAKIKRPAEAVEVNILEEKLVTENIFTGKVKGTVTAVCKKEGCWMKLEQTDGDGIMIKFRDYKYFVPMDIMGKDVVIEGVAQKEIISVEQLKNIAEEAGKPAEEIAKITEPKTEITFTAKGILVTN